MTIGSLHLLSWTWSTVRISGVKNSLPDVAYPGGTGLATRVVDCSVEVQMPTHLCSSTIGIEFLETVDWSCGYNAFVQTVQHIDITTLSGNKCCSVSSWISIGDLLLFLYCLAGKTFWLWWLTILWQSWLQ